MDMRLVVRARDGAAIKEAEAVSVIERPTLTTITAAVDGLVATVRADLALPEDAEVLRFLLFS
jgi:hypothetical protein